VGYIDTNTVHNPATGTVAPAAWGDTVRDDLEFFIDPPACAVKHSTTQSIATATTVALACNTEDFDNNAMHSTVTNNSRITIVTAGRYEFATTLRYAFHATGSRLARFQVNAGTVYEVMFVAASTATNDTTVVGGTKKLTLVAGDYVETIGFQTSGGNLNVEVLEFSAKFITR